MKTPPTKKIPRRYYLILLIIFAVIGSIGMLLMDPSLTGTDQEVSSVLIRILKGLGLLAATLGLLYGIARTGGARPPVDSSAASTTASSPTPAPGFNGSPEMLARQGAQYVLEVRGMGLVTDQYTNKELWDKLQAQPEKMRSILSQNPKDYSTSGIQQVTDLELTTRTSFRVGATAAVSYWPLPVLIVVPPKAPSRDRAATSIASLRQAASLGVHLLLWEYDANTDDGVEIIERLFDFFDQNPDVPEAVVVSQDGSTIRGLVRTPGYENKYDYINPVEHKVPALPETMVTLLVSRSDRVNTRIRPYATVQTGPLNRNTTQYDTSKLWNFFWDINDGVGPGSFEEHFEKQEAQAGVSDPVSANVQSKWWQAKLPELWKTVSNQGPGGLFTPSPYIPIRWTTWQVAQFDQAPLLGYLHRPVTVSLRQEDGTPLRTPYRAQALKAAWEQAVAALPLQEQPKRVFYDSTGDLDWTLFPLSGALSQLGPQAPQMSDDQESYDIGKRIGNTGAASPLVQIGLAMMGSYLEGGVSATVHARPQGRTTLIMFSPPEESTKEAWLQANGRPFR